LHFRSDVLSNGFSGHEGIVTAAEESFLSETRNQRIVAKLLKKLFWVKRSLLILTILLYNSVDLPLGARREKKEKKGRKFIPEFCF
jgi:hypothetical protein